MNKLFRSVNEYFFGEEQIAVADAFCFYGFVVVAVAAGLLCLSTLIAG